MSMHECKWKTDWAYDYLLWNLYVIPTIEYECRSFDNWVIFQQWIAIGICDSFEEV